MPHQIYGLPSSFGQITKISPLAYFVMVLGKALHITDVLFLYKILILLGNFFLLTGIYLLSRLLFQRNFTTVMVCIAAVSNIYLISQLEINFSLNVIRRLFRDGGMKNKTPLDEGF